jgi:hypothetical protein
LKLLCNEGVELADIVAGATPNAEILIDYVRLAPLASDGLDGAATSTQSTSGASFWIDLVSKQFRTSAGRAPLVDNVHPILILEVHQRR